MQKFVSNAWWRAAENDIAPHKILIPLMESLRSGQDGRYDSYMRLAHIYGADMTSRGGSNRVFLDLYRDDLTVNELANTVETLHAQIFKNRIVPSVVSTGGDYTTFSEAKKLTRWIDGVVDEAGFHSCVIPRSGTEMFVYGTGIFRVGYELTSDSEARITIKAVSALDCYVDIADSTDGNPQSFFQRTPCDKQALVESYVDSDAEDGLYGEEGDRLLAIMGAKSVQEVDDRLISAQNMDTDQVFVYEAWHLPTARGKFGRYTMFTDAGTILDREYEFRRFPHLFLKAIPPISGFWGESIVARIAPAQRSYDKLSTRIDVAHDLIGSPKLLVRKGSGITKSHIDDDEDCPILEFEGQPPTEWNPVPITPEAYKWRSQVVQDMRGSLGVSQMSATSQLPTQLREASGVALENWQDNEDTRHAMIHRYYESAVTEMVHVIIDIACSLKDNGISVVSRAVRGNELEVIDFKDIEIEQSAYRLKVLPVSHLARTFTGRVQQLQPLVADGTITKSTYRRLLEVPDIEAENDLDTAAEEIVDATLQMMVDEGDYYPPLAFDNLDFIIKRTTDFINKQRVNHLPEEKLSLLAQYLQDAINMKKAAQPTTAPAPMPPGGPGPMPGPNPGMSPGMPPPANGGM